MAKAILVLSGGWAEDGTDEEIVEGIKVLAETEGVFTETAGGATVAVAKKLIAQGRIPRDESLAISITGNGLKTQEAVVADLPQRQVIEAKMADFDALLAALEKGQPTTDRRTHTTCRSQ